MAKKYYMSNVNQCQRLEDGYSKIAKLTSEGDKNVFGKLYPGWDSSSLTFVTYTDILGKEHSIPRLNIEHISHGYSKWSLHFNPYAGGDEEVEFGRLAGYICVDSNEDVVFTTQSQEGAMWDFSSRDGLMIRL